MPRCKKRPEFKVGDYIVPNGAYNYSGNHKWDKNEPRVVSKVVYEEDRNYWTLRVWNPSMGVHSYYNPTNFKLSDKPSAKPNVDEGNKMAEKSVFYAVKIDPESDITHGMFSTCVGPFATKHAARVHVANIIEAQEKWVVMSTVMLIEGEEPRPPISVTEYY